MLNTLFIVLLFFSFVFGQLARFQFQNGISITLLDGAVILFSLVSLGSFLLHRRMKDIINLKLFKPFIYFVSIGFLSLLLNAPTLNGQEFIVSLLYLFRFMVYFSTTFFIGFFSKKQKTILLRSLVISVVITVSTGFLQFFYYPNLRNLYYLQWDDHLYRLFSVYLDPNFASVIFACLSLFLFSQTMQSFKKNRSRGLTWAFVSLLSVLSVFLTYSRTGMIALVVGTIILLLFNGYKKALLFLIISFACLLTITSDVKVEGLNPFRTVSTNARIESARIALLIFEKNPFIGVGFNAYRYAQHRYGFRPDDKWQTSHADAGTDNSLLFVLATTGAVGLISYLFLWYTMLKSSYVASKKSKGIFASMVFASAIAILVSSLFLNTLFYPFIMVWVLSLYGIMEST